VFTRVLISQLRIGVLRIMLASLLSRVHFVRLLPSYLPLLTIMTSSEVFEKRKTVQFLPDPRISMPLLLSPVPG